jgi:hypothetical protein
VVALAHRWWLLCRGVRHPMIRHHRAPEPPPSFFNLPLNLGHHHDGVSRTQAVRLVNVIQELPGPVFIHCHHGKHRGPTAAAICGLGSENWSKEQALDWLERAGTDPNYKGLFATVEQFTPPTDAELMSVSSKDLPEHAKVPALVEAMVQIDETLGRLKAIQKAGFKPPREDPDLEPPHEALMLAEHFREAVRQEASVKKGEQFIQLMKGSERNANDLETALREYQSHPSPRSRFEAESSLERVVRSCSICHVKFRDRPVSD